MGKYYLVATGIMSNINRYYKSIDDKLAYKINKTPEKVKKYNDDFSFVTHSQLLIN